MKKLTLVFLIVMLSGCVIWSQVKPDERFGENKGFNVELPSDWMRFHPGVEGYLITKDGLSIQRISVAKYSFEKAFPKSKKVLEPKMLITDVMDYYIAELQQKNEGVTIEIEAKEPAILAEQEAFKVTALLIAPDGLKYRIHSYGAMDEKGFYELSYQAPLIHYFERDLQIFETVRDSFQLL